MNNHSRQPKAAFDTLLQAGPSRKNKDYDQETKNKLIQSYVQHAIHLSAKKI